MNQVVQAVEAETASLAELARQINVAHALAEEGVRGGADRARRVGELLLRAKAAVGHGNWLAWLEGNVAFGVREAQRYTRIAQRWSSVRANTSPLTHLGIAEALEILTDGGEDEEELTPEGMAARLREEEEEAKRQHRSGDREPRAVNWSKWLPTAERRLTRFEAEHPTAVETVGREKVHYAVQVLTALAAAVRGSG